MKKSATFVVSVRAHIEDVATVAAYLSKKDDTIRSKNQIILAGFSFAAQLIRENHPSLKFDVEESVRILSNLGLDPFKNNRGAKALLRELQYKSLNHFNEQQDQFASEIIDEHSVIAEEDVKEAEKRRDEELNSQIKTFKDITGLLISEEDNK